MNSETIINKEEKSYIPSFEESRESPAVSQEKIKKIIFKNAEIIQASLNERFDKYPELSEQLDELKGDLNVIMKDFELFEKEPYDPVFEKISRDVVTSEFVERFKNNEKLSLNELYAIKGIISRKNWLKLFNNVKPGKYLLSFLVPSSKIFHMKNLNDNIFGAQNTDNIIIERRKVLSQALRDSQVLKDQGVNIDELEQTYKDGYFIMDSYNEEIAEELKNILNTVNEQLNKYIINLAKDVRLNNEVKNEEKFKEFEQAIASPDTMYKMTFGISKVREQKQTDKGGDYTHVEDAVHKSLQAASLARETDKYEDGGVEYTPDKIDTIHKEIIKLKTDILSLAEEVNGRTVIKDLKGREFDLFIQKQTEENGEIISLGIEVLNKDISRDVRKDKFKPFMQEGNEGNVKLLDLIYQYMRKVNIIDYIKPFIHDEFMGNNVYGRDNETISAQMDILNNLSNKMDYLCTEEQVRATEERLQELHKLVTETEGSVNKETANSLYSEIEQLEQKKLKLIKKLESQQEYSKITSEDKEAIRNIINTETKDQSCTSSIEFHNKALEIGDCTYISMDVLDLGPDLLQEFEEVFSGLNNKNLTKEKKENIIIQAGDGITKRMRDIRKKVVNVCKQANVFEGQVPILVGGDEITIVLPTQNVTEELLHNLKQETNTRLITTAVAESTRSSQTDDKDALLKEHMEALKKAEAGGDLSKVFEAKIRDLNFYMPKLSEADVQYYEEIIKNMKKYIVRENPDKKSSDIFLIVSRNNEILTEKEFDVKLENLQKELESKQIK